MTKSNRRTVLSMLGATALTACAAPEIVTRIDKDPFEGGIGGTGIVGVVTDFGSVVVNGLRVELTERTRIRTGFGVVSDSALATGQALTIFATRSRDALVARNISIDYALIGMLERDALNRLSVNSVAVRPEPGALGTITPGARVAVSGLWAGDHLVASRFDPAPDGEDLIAGTGIRDGASGFQIGGQPLRLPGLLPSGGQYAVALGRNTADGFEASSLALGRFQGAASLRQLSVEGYLEAVARAPGFRIAGLGHGFARNLDLAALAPERAIYFGRYDGLFGASAGYVVPENFRSRRVLLRGGYSDGFDGKVIKV